MFRAALDDSTPLKKALSVVGELVDQGNFMATPEGLSFQSMDSAHVALVSLDVPASCFSEFEAEEPVVFGVVIEHVNKALGCSISGKRMRMTVGGDALAFDFEDASFGTKLLDIDSERVDMPMSEPWATLEMPSTAFQRVIKDLAAFGDVVTLHAAGGTVSFRSSGDVGTASVCLASMAEVSAPRDFEAQFALRYLSTFAKGASAAPVVRVCASPDMPVEVTYAIGEGRLSFYLAPKISDDM